MSADFLCDDDDDDLFADDDGHPVESATEDDLSFARTPSPFFFWGYRSPWAERANLDLLHEFLWDRASARECASMLLASQPEAAWKEQLEGVTRSTIIESMRSLLSSVPVRYRETEEDRARAEEARKALASKSVKLWSAEWNACERALHPQWSTQLLSEGQIGRATHSLYFALVEQTGAALPALEVWKLLDNAGTSDHEELGRRLLGDFRPTTEWSDEHESDAGVAARRRIAHVEQQEDVFVFALYPRVDLPTARSLRGLVVSHAYHLLHGWAFVPASEALKSAYR